MRINLYGQRRDDELVAEKIGDTLALNGVGFDFSPMNDGDSLPISAISSGWFSYDVEKVGGELVIGLILPNLWNYSPAQAFPEPLLNVPDGRVGFPLPLPDENGQYPDLPPLPAPIVAGSIDWSKLITQAMKDAALLAEQLASSQAQLNALTRQANAQVTALQGRITTLNWLLYEQDPEDPDYMEPTPEDVAELPVRKTQLTKWNSYNAKLGKVKLQATWPSAPVWPVMPEPYTNETSVQAPDLI